MQKYCSSHFINEFRETFQTKLNLSLRKQKFHTVRVTHQRGTEQEK